MALYSSRNALSCHASRNAAPSAMHAGISDSGMKRPPNSPNRPDDPGSPIPGVLFRNSDVMCAYFCKERWGRWSSGPLFPVEGGVVAAFVGAGIGGFGRGDEGPQPARVLAAGLAF